MNPSKAIHNPRAIALAAFLFGALFIGILFGQTGFWLSLTSVDFDGERAYGHVVAQVNFGPRITGTQPNIEAGDYILRHLKQSGWEAEIQPFTYKGTQGRNIIARANVGKGPIVILGAHYDTRKRADKDKDRPNDPVPGANDGASGTAVILDLARSLDLDRVPNEIWLAFFDAEDNGELDDWTWIVGSSHMADHLGDVQPQAMILVDMVGDRHQQLYFEKNSDPALSRKIWETAARLGYRQQFIPEPRWALLDDHIPFTRRNIPAANIIDFDYPYWHTTADTVDKVSAESLHRVGRTLETFLETLGK
jgi:Zn-dependent M28 family amino/carboxypeptidase